MFDEGTLVCYPDELTHQTARPLVTFPERPQGVAPVACHTQTKRKSLHRSHSPLSRDWWHRSSFTCTCEGISVFFCKQPQVVPPVAFLKHPQGVAPPVASHQPLQRLRQSRSSSTRKGWHRWRSIVTWKGWRRSRPTSTRKGYTGRIPQAPGSGGAGRVPCPPARGGTCRVRRAHARLLPERVATSNRPTTGRVPRAPARCGVLARGLVSRRC